MSGTHRQQSKIADSTTIIVDLLRTYVVNFEQGAECVVWRILIAFVDGVENSHCIC